MDSQIKMSLKGIVLSLLAAGTIGAAFVGIDYSASKDMDRNSLRLRARVGQESIAYKKFGFGTDYTTEGEGLTGKIGVNVRKAMNFGNRDVAYVVEPQELRYMTQGAFQKSSNSKKSIEAALADEIINAYKMSNNSAAISKKLEVERQADSSR